MSASTLRSSPRPRQPGDKAVCGPTTGPRRVRTSTARGSPASFGPGHGWRSPAPVPPPGWRACSNSPAPVTRCQLEDRLRRRRARNPSDPHVFDGSPRRRTSLMTFFRSSDRRRIRYCHGSFGCEVILRRCLAYALACLPFHDFLTWNRFWRRSCLFVFSITMTSRNRPDPRAVTPPEPLLPSAPPPATACGPGRGPAVPPWGGADRELCRPSTQHLLHLRPLPSRPIVVERGPAEPGG